MREVVSQGTFDGIVYSLGQRFVADDSWPPSHNELIAHLSWVLCDVSCNEVARQLRRAVSKEVPRTSRNIDVWKQN